MNSDFSEQRRRELARFLKQMGFGPKKPIDTLSSSEVKENLRSFGFKAGGVLVLIVGWFIWGLLQPRHVEPPPPKVTYEDIGTVTRISVHYATFHTDSTVETDRGTFQVGGAVSAFIGSQVALKTTARSGGSEFEEICIAKRIGASPKEIAHCYLLK